MTTSQKNPKPLAVVKTAAIYLRYSTDKQDPTSLVDQEKRCRAWAAANGYTVAAVYADPAKSGTTEADRPEYLRLVADAKDSGWSAVLVNDHSRSNRKLWHSLRLQERLTSYGITLVDCTSGMRSTDPQAKVLTVFNGLQAESYIDAIRDRTVQALQGRAERGEWCGGRCYGFTTVRGRPDDEKSPKVPIINEEQAAVVVRIFTEYAGGAGLRTIADGLNRDAIPAPYDSPKLGYGHKAGKGWGHTSVNAILRNERYRGRFTWNVRAWIKDLDTERKVAHARPKSEHKVTERPELAIVPVELWDTVQSRLAQRALHLGIPKAKRGSTPSKPSPLATLVKCGWCGGPMSLSGVSGNGRSLGCSTRRSKGKHGPCSNQHMIQESRVLDFVADVVKQALEAKTGDAAFKDFERHMLQLQAGQSKRPDIARLDAAVRKAQANVSKQWTTLTDIGVTEFGRAQYKEAEAELARRKADRTAADAPANGRPWSPELLRKTVRLIWEQLEGALSTTDPFNLGPLLRQHIERIVLSPRVNGPRGADFTNDGRGIDWTMDVEVKVPAPSDRAGTQLADGHCGGGI